MISEYTRRELSRLARGEAITTVIDTCDISKLHELIWTKSIFMCYNEKTHEEKTVIKLTKKRGSKSNIKSFLKFGKIVLA